jgi:ABC-type bacteriocin/lantibiotic exporter with double-glycine peptidase domain
VRPLAAPVLALVFAAVFAGGCQTVRDETLSPSAVVLDLPMVQQDELYECGLAAITAECRYYDISIPENERKQLVAMAAERKGLSGAELRDALERMGLEVFIFAGARDRSPTGLYTQVDKQRPPLVMLAPAPDVHHYCLFLGYDEPLGNVVLLDPRRGRILMHGDAFDKAWSSAEHFTLLAVPADKQPPTDPMTSPSKTSSPF